MEYSKIIAVTGLPGLYELISSKNDGAIVRSLDDGSTRFVSSRVHNFSHLESIEVYTVRDNVNLAEIFQAMESKGDGLPDEKDAKGVKAYFEKVYGDIDFERVYNSDMKKMIKWYSILKAKGVEIRLSEPEPEAAAAEEEVPVTAVPETPVAEEKPRKKPAKAKATEPQEEEPAKPAAKKKAPAKSAKKEEGTDEPVKKTASKSAGKQDSKKK